MDSFDLDLTRENRRTQTRHFLCFF